MSKARVLLFDQYSFIGGGQIVFLTSIESAIRAGLEPVVIVPTGGSLEEELRRRYHAAIAIESTAELRATHGKKTFLDVVRFSMFTLRFIIQHFRQFGNADLIYGNGPRQFLGIMFLSVVCRRPACYHVHIDHSRIEKRLIALAAWLSTTYKIILNSEFTKERLLTYMPSLRRSSKIVVVENGLDRAYSSRYFVNRFSHKLHNWNVVVVGVLRPEKGQDIAVDLAERLDWIHLHLIGRVGQGAEDWARQLVDRATDNVIFHGAVNDVPGTLDHLNAHINLVPSRWDEPFGLAAIEGMACSCITLVNRSGALIDIAEKTGAVVYESDIHNLESAFKRIANLSCKELSALADIQFKLTMREYGPERFASNMSQLFVERPR